MSEIIRAAVLGFMALIIYKSATMAERTPDERCLYEMLCP